MCYLLGVAVNRMFVRVRVFMESASLVEPQTGFRYIVWLPQIPENLRDVQAVSIFHYIIFIVEIACKNRKKKYFI